MDVHRRVHQRIPLTQAHFDRWLALWRDSVDRRYAGPSAEQAKAHTARMASVFLRNLTAPTVPGSLPLVPARREPQPRGPEHQPAGPCRST
jgi:hemoglobin